jgi:hypothetical protein
MSARWIRRQRGRGLRLQGIMRFGQEGTRKTPANDVSSCDILGDIHTSDGDDVHAGPGRAPAAFGAESAIAGTERARNGMREMRRKASRRPGVRYRHGPC